MQCLIALLSNRTQAVSSLPLLARYYFVSVLQYLSGIAEEKIRDVELP